MFRRSDRAQPVPDERAMAARNAATQAFLSLDNEQRAAAAAVEAAEALGTGQLARAWVTVAALGDRATDAYLTATTDVPVSRGSQRADENATAEIEKAREAIRRFRASHSRVLDEAEMALRGLPLAVAEARTMLTTAREAVAAGQEEGVGSRRAAERLAEAERASALLGSPALRDRREAAQHTLELARAAAQLAVDAPQTARQVRNSFGSIGTRRAAAQTRTERIRPALSQLRREFSGPCSAGLDDAEERATASLAEADSLLQRARRHADAGEWDDAADGITDVRAALGRAEERADAVTSRVTELHEVRDNPAKQAADTRFVLRDAQRLVVDRDMVKRFGPVLDAQSVRLQNAQDRLTGVHPDYWFYLTELRGIRERVGQVVADVRAAAAR